MKKILVTLLAVLLIFSLVACGNGKDDDKTGGEAGPYVDGTYQWVSGTYDGNYMDAATMTVENGNITSLIFDCYKVDGTMKRDEVAAGNYVMVEGNPTWTEQADAVAAYIIENNSTEGVQRDDGYGNTEIDALASVSIHVTGFTAGAEALMEMATPGYVAEEPLYNDGTYTWEAEEFGSTGYKDMAEMVVVAGKIVVLKFDCVKEDGVLKRDEVAAGEYVMVEGNPTWTQQADAVAKYIINNNSTEGVQRDDGYGNTEIDALATVSIHVTGFTAGAEALMAQAAK